MMQPSRAFHLVAALVATLTINGPASAQLTSFFEDFESLDRTDPNVLIDNGWNFFAAGINGNDDFPNFGEFNPGGGPPNNISDPNITVISETMGGDPPAGNQGLVVFTDNQSPLVRDEGDLDPRDLVISIFQERTITADDIDNTITFSWLAEGNSAPPTGDALAEAFLLTIDPNNGFSATNNLAVDTTNVPDGDPTPGSLTLELSNPLLVGQLLQFGFRITASDFEDSAVDYDNVRLLVPGDEIDGDFNFDLVVNAADYTVYRDGASPNGLASLQDFDVFAANFGAGSAPQAGATVTAVPEPNAALMLLAGALVLRFRRR